MFHRINRTNTEVPVGKWTFLSIHTKSHILAYVVEAIVVKKFFGLCSAQIPADIEKTSGWEPNEKVRTSVKNHPLLRLISFQKDDMRAAFGWVRNDICRVYLHNIDLIQNPRKFPWKGKHETLLNCYYIESALVLILFCTLLFTSWFNLQ